MKRNVSPPRGKIKGFLALATLLAPAMLWAQVSIYEFSQSVETYSDITAADGGYSLGAPTWWPPVYNQRAFVDPNILEGTVTNSYLNGASGPGFPIGFDLTFNGDVFDRIGISNCGWISFGKSSDANQAVWTYSSDHPHGRPFVQYYGGPDVPYKRNRVAGWANSALYMQDMSPLDPPGPITTLRMATIGVAPNRVCVVQWKDYLIGYPPSSTRVNFQIRLNEADNSVEVRYGTSIYTGAEVQVGLGGQIPEDFNSRMTVYEEPAFLYDWNTTVAGTVNTDAITAAATQPGQPNGSGVPPAVGLNFKWTPPVCPPPAWPLAIGDLSFDYALAQWQATSAGEYGYFVTTENDVNGPEVTSGTTTDPEAYLFGLTPATNYYIFVRSICGGEPGVWSLATSFLTHGGGLVVCDGGVVNEDYCSHQFDTVDWDYISADGSPLKIEMQGGFVNTTSLQLWDGPPIGPAQMSLSADITGQNFLASSGQIHIRLITDAGSCETQPWFLPLQWKVGCKNCTDPLVQYSIGEVDCAAEHYFVDVNIFSLGSSATLVLENSLGLPATTVSTTGVHAVGPFPAGDVVTITAQNPDNEMCYSTSAVQVNEPCAILDCGPTWYSKCAGPSETREWLVEGDGQPISVRFPPGYMGWDSEVKVFNGSDESTPVLFTTSSGSTNNQVVTTTNPDNRLMIRYVSSQYNDYACTLGNSLPLEFVVECGDACVQPTATFSYAPCTEAATFNVLVDLTTVGSAGSVTITNDGGAPEVVATTIGSYSVGPFPSSSVVELEVEGADQVCSWTSAKLTKDCSDVGISENTSRTLNVYPNPSEGRFTLTIPTGLSGNMDLQVQDITGRVVADQRIANGASQQAVLELGHLPNGVYFMVLNTGTQRFVGRVQIVH